jgi:hypothetical protein
MKKLFCFSIFLVFSILLVFSAYAQERVYQLEVRGKDVKFTGKAQFDNGKGGFLEYKLEGSSSKDFVLSSNDSFLVILKNESNSDLWAGLRDIKDGKIYVETSTNSNGGTVILGLGKGPHPSPDEKPSVKEKISEKKASN